MSTPEAKPLPDVNDPLTAPFWAAATEHKLSFQICGECGHARWPAASSCPQCLSTTAKWTEVPGIGTIWSLAVYEQVDHPAFQDELPYAIGAITLDAGPMMVSRVRGNPTELEVGQRVATSFNDVAEGVTLVEFEVNESEVDND